MAVIDLEPLAIDTASNYGDDDDETRRQREAQAAALAMMSQPDRGADTGLVPSRGGRPSMPSYAQSAPAEELAPRYVRRPDRGGAPSPMEPARTPEPSTPSPQAARLAEQGMSILRSRDPRSSAKSPETELANAYDARDRRRGMGTALGALGLLLGGGSRAVEAATADPDRPVRELMQRREVEATDQARRRSTSDAQAAQALAARSRDPSSPESQRAQQMVRSVLPGQPDEFYSSLTAADLADNGPLARLMAGRQRSDTQIVLQDTRGQQQAGLQETRGQQAVEQIGARGDEERETEGVRQEGRMELAAANNAARADIARLRGSLRRRLGGGGRGGAGAAAPSVDDLRAAYVDAMREAGTDLTDEQLQLRARSLSPRDLGAVVRAEGTARTGGAERSEIAGSNAERASQITGWRRRPDAPEIGTAERSRLREAHATMEQIRRPLRELAQIHEQVTAAERAGARADVLSPLMARARVAHEQVITGLRNIGNYGVPQAAELARMESIATRLESPAGFLSAGNIYPALERGLGNQVADQLAAYGYERDTGGGGGRAQGDTVRVRYNGRVLQVARANLQRAIADGAEVLE